MYKYLKNLRFKSYTALEIDKKGTIVRNTDGTPIYIPVNRKDCYDIGYTLCNALCKNTIYDLPWFIGDECETLTLLDPSNPKSKMLANYSLERMKKHFKDEAEKTQCLYFGKCEREFEICYDCSNYGSEECIVCKKRCRQCQQKVSRTVSYDATFRNDGDSDMTSKYEPVATNDTAQETVDKTVLDALYEAIGALDEKDGKIISTIEIHEGTFRDAQKACGFKSVNSVQKRYPKAIKSLGENETLKNFF